MNKQIEEMAKVLCNHCAGKESPCTVAKSGTMCRCVQREAEALYNAGYLKQEWISVEERLPDRNGRYLTHCNVKGQSLVCILYFCKVGGFNEGTVTHWMPLPEPPMKGDKTDA